MFNSSSVTSSLTVRTHVHAGLIQTTVTRASDDVVRRVDVKLVTGSDASLRHAVDFRRRAGRGVTQQTHVCPFILYN